MKKILIIEDNQFLRTTTADILQLAGYEVIQAEHGKAGVERAQLDRPDMIVCDVEMPELDGYGVLHYLSNDPKTAMIPFIFLTSRDGADEMRRGMSSVQNLCFSSQFWALIIFTIKRIKLVIGYI